MKHEMHSWLALSLIVFIMSTIPSTSGVITNVAANLTDIQTALATAQEGDTIVIGAGAVDLNTTTLTLATLGVTIRGAGPGQTIFSSNSSSLTTMLDVDAGSSPNATTPPIVIEGISFRNSATDILTAALGPQIGLRILTPGWPGNPSVVRNCQFLNFAQEYAALTVPPNHWTVEGNLFDGNRFSCRANVASGLTMTGNTFTRFIRGVEVYGGVSLDVTIEGNTFANPADFAPPLGIGATYLGVLLSDGASTANQDKQFSITNNLFSGLDIGMNFLEQSSAPTQSVTGINITLNAFVDFRTSGVQQYVSVDNSAFKLPAIENWYGQAYGPADPSLNFLNVDPYQPWIAQYQDDPEHIGEPGFWPINIVLGDSLVPTIISAVVDTPPVFGAFTLNVTVSDIPYGASVVVTSEPEGVLICSPDAFAGGVGPQTVTLDCTTNATFNNAVDPDPLLYVDVTSTAGRGLIDGQFVRVISSVPHITRFEFDPLFVVAPFPATVALTVFLQGFVLGGTVAFPDLPEGISCPDTAYDTLQADVTVVCTVSNITAGAYPVNVTVTTSAGFTDSQTAQFLVVNEISQCTSGTCCNRDTQQLRPQGYPCGTPAHDCDAQGTCSGNSSECQSRPAQDGTPCAWQPDRGGWSPFISPYGQQQPALLSAFMRDDSRLKTYTVNESDARPGAANTHGAKIQYSRKYGGGKESYGQCVGSCLAGVCVIKVDHPVCCRPKQPGTDKLPVWYTHVDGAKEQWEHEYDNPSDYYPRRQHHYYDDKRGDRRREGYRGNSRLDDHGAPGYHNDFDDYYKHRLQCWE